MTRKQKIKTLEAEQQKIKSEQHTLNEWLVRCADLIKINVQLKMLKNA